MLLAAVGAVGAGGAPAADADVQRQIQQREQQELELQLRMQQQNERALSPGKPLGARLRERAVERDQQQRLQHQHDQAQRATIPPALEGPGRVEAERQRSLRAGSGELDRMGVERRYESGRPVTPGDSTR